MRLKWSFWGELGPARARDVRIFLFSENYHVTQISFFQKKITSCCKRSEETTSLTSPPSIPHPILPFLPHKTLRQKRPPPNQETMASFSPLRPLLRAANSTPSSFLVRSTQRSSPFSSTAAQNYARLTIVGRLGADPELISTTSGQELVKYHVATTSGKSDNRQTSWFHITHFVAPEGRTRDYVLGLQKGFVLLCFFFFV